MKYLSDTSIPPFSYNDGYGPTLPHLTNKNKSANLIIRGCSQYTEWWDKQAGKQYKVSPEKDYHSLNNLLIKSVTCLNNRLCAKTKMYNVHRQVLIHLTASRSATLKESCLASGMRIKFYQNISPDFVGLQILQADHISITTIILPSSLKVLFPTRDFYT